MKLCVSYSNCQGQGLVHFLRKSRMADHYEFVHYNNYQIILGEQTPEDLMAHSARADVFLYQPTPALKYGMLSTEEMLTQTVPAGAYRLCLGYGFNFGLFPIVHHGSWRVTQEIKDRAKTDKEGLLNDYDNYKLSFGSTARFLECLTEQDHRERTSLCHLPMADFILTAFQHERLFLSENHPCSAYFAELARRTLRALEPTWDDYIPYVNDNEAQLPCSIPMHPKTICELGIGYAADLGAQAFYRGQLEKLIEDLNRPT